jgi:hypothetical protein
MKNLYLVAFIFAASNSQASPQALQCAQVGIVEAQGDLQAALANRSTPKYIRHAVACQCYRSKRRNG